MMHVQNVGVTITLDTNLLNATELKMFGKECLMFMYVFAHSHHSRHVKHECSHLFVKSQCEVLHQAFCHHHLGI